MQFNVEVNLLLSAQVHKCQYQLANKSSSFLSEKIRCKQSLLSRFTDCYVYVYQLQLQNPTMWLLSILLKEY